MFRWMILLLSIGFLMMCRISVLYLLGLFSCEGCGICWFSEVLVFVGNEVSSGVLNRFGVMVIIWISLLVRLWVIGRVMLIMLFLDVE